MLGPKLTFLRPADKTAPQPRPARSPARCALVGPAAAQVASSELGNSFSGCHNFFSGLFLAEACLLTVARAKSPCLRANSCLDGRAAPRHLGPSHKIEPLGPKRPRIPTRPRRRRRTRPRTRAWTWTSVASASMSLPPRAAEHPDPCHSVCPRHVLRLCCSAKLPVQARRDPPRTDRLRAGAGGRCLRPPCLAVARE